VLFIWEQKRSNKLVEKENDMNLKIKLLILMTSVLSGNLFAKDMVTHVSIYCWHEAFGYTEYKLTGGIRLGNITRDTYTRDSDRCSMTMDPDGRMVTRCAGKVETSYITSAVVEEHKIKFTDSSRDGEFYDSYASVKVEGGTIGSELKLNEHKVLMPHYFGTLYFDPQSVSCDAERSISCMGDKEKMDNFKPVSLTFDSYQNTATLKQLNKEENITCLVGDNLK
jgi:hypothetical protein